MYLLNSRSISFFECPSECCLWLMAWIAAFGLLVELLSGHYLCRLVYGLGFISNAMYNLSNLLLYEYSLVGYVVIYLVLYIVILLR